MKKIVAAVSILFSLSALLFAHGKNDITERSVNQERSWREIFDLNDKKDGKYNILVKVEDQGGNETLGGPFNIWVDPESDLPIVGITNPAMNMRIPGNLNIVGTCIDDDAVEKVELILDGDIENIQLAQGKDFWSYYLDTTELEEGPHTIEVYGTDINGLRGHSVKVTWNLDRRQPVTEITNYGMGTLVSGKINLKGTVYDGNGMQSLLYSTNNGTTFNEAKLSVNKKTKIATFNIPIDTRELKDGPTVCWFKGIDQMGSVGIYSFLYFIDNTAPDVQIVSPERNEVMNGKFAIAGYARDSMGIRSLTWTLGDESGEFELIPGNPYFYKEVDTLGSTAKDITFTVTATDIADNVVTKKRTIPLNQEADKPVITIEYPTSETVVDGDAGSVFIRGLATDDDGVASVMYAIDGGREHVIRSQGVFYEVLSPDVDLRGGSHTVTAYAVDKYGVAGDPQSVTFFVRGGTPIFEAATVKTNEGSQAAVPGLLIHPETEASLETSVISDSGIKRVGYKFEWGERGSLEKTIPLPEKGPAPTSFPISIPLNEAPWGLARITIFATDIYERTVEQKTVLHIKDLTRAAADKPEVIFSDSRVSDAGDVINDPQYPVTGYFVGATAKSVQIVPATPFATAELRDNVIILRATNAKGTSAPVRVRVTTDQGLSYNSRELIFHSDNAAPVVRIDGADHRKALDGSQRIHISGTVQSDSPLSRFGYRILTANAQVTSDFVMGVDALPVSLATINTVGVRGGKFEFDVEPYNFVRGMYVIEVIAENGRQGADAVFVRKLPPLPAMSLDGTKAAVATPPEVSWFDGVDVYYVTTYQGDVDNLCGVYKRDEMTPGVHELAVTGKTGAGKAYSSKFTARKEGGVKVSLKAINGTAYASGMNVPIPRGSSIKEGGATLVAAIETETPLSAVSYEITGEKAPAGDLRQSGKALSITQIDAKHYEATIPLANLPARITKVKVIADTQKGSGSYEGTVNITRPFDTSKIDDSRKFYWLPQEDAVYDVKENKYSLSPGATFGGYANMPAPITASLISSVNGLSVTVDGNKIEIAGQIDGFYRNVALRIRDGQGAEYTSSTVNLLFDSRLPDVAILSPKAHQWVRDVVQVEAEATDANGIARAEYSFDSGEHWTAFSRRGSTPNSYVAQLRLSNVPDGLVKVDVRAFDRAGKMRHVGTAIQKDTVAPEVKVVVPMEEDIINGENTIAFLAKDDGYLDHAEYIAPPTGAPAAPIRIDISPMTMTHVGTKDKPLHDLMTFNFYDAAGNVTRLRSWDFIVDQESDLPVAEIHLPEEDSVITKDFIISGVIYDDDGPCKLWYKIDDAPYRALPDRANNFSIEVPLLSMTDNEHKVTVYAEDINGVKGPEFVRNFKISLEEPKGEVLDPPISETVKESITIHGRATDKNGIKAVYVSIDNGNTYNEARGTFGHDKIDTEWNYTIDTRVVQDGTHVLFYRVIDWYGIEGLYSSLLNIDNTNPDISLELPLDGSVTTGMVFFSGQTTDNIELTELYISVRSLDGKPVNEKLARIDLDVSTIITQAIDLKGLENGLYNIELLGADAANNITRVSRNITLNKNAPKAKVDVLYPLNGEEVRGVFNIYGTAVSEETIEKLFLFVDGKQTDETKLSDVGYYKFQLNSTLLADGQHKIRVQALLSSGRKIISDEQYINYTSFGPWVTIDNFTYGDFAVKRPYLRGEAGYTIPEEELVAAKVKGASKEVKEAVDAKSVEKIELSLDNGKTFQQISSSGKWRYRIENKDIPEGYHFLLLRATMKNGETAITRTIVQVDNTAPTVKLISPGAGGRYNQELAFSGLTNDDVSLKDVTLFLRKGDKARYEVPGFIQGLYFDWHFWGATLFDIGMGLTFFDDNVKLQVQWGQFTKTQWHLFKEGEYRYGGNNIIGAKLLANVYYLPFRYLWGPDWEWLSMNIALGANFTRFSDSGAGKAQILSAALAQIEFPRVTFENQKNFRTMAFYTEGQLWFIPSDVSSDDAKTIVPQISFGLRVNVF